MGPVCARVCTEGLRTEAALPRRLWSAPRQRADTNVPCPCPFLPLTSSQSFPLKVCVLFHRAINFVLPTAHRGAPRCSPVIAGSQTVWKARTVPATVSDGQLNVSWKSDHSAVLSTILSRPSLLRGALEHVAFYGATRAMPRTRQPQRPSNN